jgi:hypothetical protein
MFTPEDYRAEAARYGRCAKVAEGEDEKANFRRLENTFGSLADNAQWLVDHPDQIIRSKVCDVKDQRNPFKRAIRRPTAHCLSKRQVGEDSDILRSETAKARPWRLSRCSPRTRSV